MKAQNPSGIAAGIRGVWLSLAVAGTIWLGTAEGLGLFSPLLSSLAPEEKPLRQVELLVLEARPNKVTVGLYVGLSQGWYLYWLNPGDAGLAPEIRWKLPAGHEAGKLRFPTPQKFVHGDIVTYGFTDEALILCDVRRPSTLPTMPNPLITAEFGWMACKESCISGETTVQVDLSNPSSEAIQKSKPVFSRFAKRYPKSVSAAELTANEARLIKSAGGWTVEAALSGREADRVTDFYPYPLDDFVINHQGISLKESKIIIPVAPSSASAVLSVLSGLLIIDGAGFQISIPVKE